MNANYSNHKSAHTSDQRDLGPLIQMLLSDEFRVTWFETINRLHLSRFDHLFAKSSWPGPISLDGDLGSLNP